MSVFWGREGEPEQRVCPGELKKWEEEREKQRSWEITVFIRYLFLTSWLMPWGRWGGGGLNGQEFEINRTLLAF